MGIMNISKHKKIEGGYVLQFLEKADFDASFLRLSKKYYDDVTLTFNYRTILAKDEKQKIESITDQASALFKLRLGIFFKDEMIGWSYSRQEPSDSLYMQNSGIVPEHRRKGLYTYLVRETLALAEKLGFQSVWSLHRTTNNAVVIPKLKEGFIITGMDISDSFGTRVKLAYYFNPTRRKIMDYRVGQIKIDNQLKNLLS
jgi:ribosomal protein S18 acetylase RimI-like enzyme